MKSPESEIIHEESERIRDTIDFEKTRRESETIREEQVKHR